MNRELQIALVSLLLVGLAPQGIRAQENPSSPKEISGEIESLRKKLEQQAAQIDQLQRSLQYQADLDRKSVV